jgi:hypothetical protein
MKIYFKTDHIFLPSPYDNYCEKNIGGKIMNNNQNLTSKREQIDGGNGFKIIEINVSDPSENLFALVTPVKMK